MSTQLFTSALSQLIADTKRKHPEIKTAAEKSLSDLKSLPSTSEAQLAADLRKRPYFVTPFLLSCSSKNPKFAAVSLGCLQRLVVSNGLAQGTLGEVLASIKDCATLDQSIQLKILQILPILLQNYNNWISGELLANALQICLALLSSKVPVIHSTATATLQQLVVSVFEKVIQEDEIGKEDNYIQDVPVEGGDLSVRAFALDAYRLLNDLCLLVDGRKPEFLESVSLPANLGLELIEGILSNNAELVASHPELVHVLRLRLMPFIIRTLSDRVTFSQSVRALRLLPLIFNSMLQVLSTECEVVFSLLNHMLDPDAGASWQRVLCMEVIQAVHAEPALVRDMFAHYDAVEKKRNIVQDQMATMVRLAAEKPSIIGLGQQSTMPAASSRPDDELDQMAALQAEGMSGTIGVAMPIKASTAPGISAGLSGMKVPCLEMLDKIEPPSIPPAYIYGIVLTTLNSFSEGIAKFLLPFTVPSDTKNRRKARAKDAESPDRKADDDEGDSSRPKMARVPSTQNFKLPVDPLSLESHVLYEQIKTSSQIVDTCWPALLAAYSTFFHAALDSDYYRALVRSFQKFTQIAGLLRYDMPRDAFLTTLGKNSVPAIPLNFSLVDEDSQTGGEKTSGETPVDSRRPSLDNRPSMNTRNLLCLRALLNLGIALGPVLEKAWKIIFETLQQADLIIGLIIDQRRSGNKEEDFLGDITKEINTVGTAATRMFESTNELPIESFLQAVTCLCNLLPGTGDAPSNTLRRKPSMPLSPQHGRTLSASSIGPSTISDPRMDIFVVDKINTVIEFNQFRFLENPIGKNGWTTIVTTLTNIISSPFRHPNLRINASKVLCSLVEVTTSSEMFEEVRSDTRLQGLQSLKKQINHLYFNVPEGDAKSAKAYDLEIHGLFIEALGSALEHYGESLTEGWDIVLSIILTVFEPQSSGSIGGGGKPPRARSMKLLRSAFTSVQLVCSDFLQPLPDTCLLTLLTVIHAFCGQQDDFNISLTSTTLCCNVSDYLLSRGENTGLEAFLSKDLMSHRELSSREGSLASTSELQLRLLLSLVETSTDPRLEIRQGAIHSAFRILDSLGDKLQPNDIIVCHRIVTIKLFSQNGEAFANAKKLKSPEKEGAIAGWNETAVLLLDKTSAVLTLNLPAMIDHPKFGETWKELLNHFKEILQRKYLTLSTAVFSALSKILAEVGEAKGGFTGHANIAWNLWVSGNPSGDSGELKKAPDNQNALAAYVEAFEELYPLVDEKTQKEEISTVLQQLQKAVADSSPTTYAGDIENVTPLQEQILKSLKLIRLDADGSLSDVIKCTAAFCSLPYKIQRLKPSDKGPTCVAFSKRAIELLETLVVDHEKIKRIYSDGSLAFALHSLGEVIQRKYIWEPEGKIPTWKIATTALVHILSAIIPILETNKSPQEEQIKVWQESIVAFSWVVSASPPASMERSNVLADQDFDIEAFERIYKLLVPRLGAEALPDRLRRAFAESVFQNSLVHEPHPDDVPAPGQEPLRALQSIHIGRTNELEPTRRRKMAYRLLDTLFALVAAHEAKSSADGENAAEWIRLSRAAAPYLILRVGLALKSYALDQPLRGHMPCPLSQRAELLYLIKRLVELESEPRAIPDTPGVAASRKKKHLHRTQGLMIGALRVAERDEELRRALMRAVKEVAADLGFD